MEKTNNKTGKSKNEENIPSEQSLLYSLFGLSKNCTTSQIKYSYRKLVLVCHPDKNQDDKQAKSKFQKLNEAYKILIDPVKRAFYDRTGEIEGEGVSDISKFVDAYVFYRKKFHEVSVNDIEEYKSLYVGGKEEKEDLLNFIKETKGDLSSILEYIPYSSNKDKNRFIDFFRKGFSKGEINADFRNKFEASSKSIRDVKEELDEKESKKEIDSLISQIKGRQKQRGNDIMASLLSKYEGDHLFLENDPLEKKPQKKFNS